MPIESRCQDGIRHVRDLLGETGEGEERLQTTCRSDIYGMKEGGERRKLDWKGVVLNYEANEESSSNIALGEYPPLAGLGLSEDHHCS